MITTPNEYMQSVNGSGREWLIEFFDYMKERHPGITPVMFRQRPMYKVGNSYVMFTAAKDYFSLHTLNFDLIEELKRKIPKSRNGKGCVNIRYANEAAKPILKAACDQIVAINSREHELPVDETAKLPYNEQMDKAFALSKAKWRPLYLELLSAARRALPEFHEHFPAMGILWKHTTTFAGVKFTKSVMLIEFYADRLHPERNPASHLKTSANRVMHLVEVSGAANFNTIIEWLAESYQLTMKK